jgi:MFS family permease
LSEKSKTVNQPLGATFNKLWSATLASNVADGLLKTSAPLLAATLTRDPVVVAALSAVIMLPWLFFAIPIGSLVDRVDRRKALWVASVLRLMAAAFLTIAIATDFVNIPILYTVAFVMGAAEVLYDTTGQALIPQILKPEQLERGNSRLAIGATMLGELFGSPMSGILYALAIVLPFFSGSLAILLAVILIALVPGTYRAVIALDDLGEPAAKKSLWADMRFGISYLINDKVLLKLVLLTTSIGFFFSASSSTMVLFMLDVLKVPFAMFGFVFLAGALGNVLGSVLAPKLSQRFGRMNMMALAIFLSGLFSVFSGLAPNVWVWIVWSVFTGICISQWNILLMSTYHQIIPNELFGRIHGTRRTLVWGLMPIGSLLGGVIALIDLRAPLIICGAIGALIALFGAPFIRSLSKLLPEPETHPETKAAPSQKSDAS